MRAPLLASMLLLAACAAPLGREEARLAPGPGGTLEGEVGLGYTNARIRDEIIGPECARRGLGIAALRIGRTEGGARRVSATCG